MQKQKFTMQTFAELTRLEQTLFGLPFTLAGALLPFAYFPADQLLTLRWLWLLPAFLTARMSGMAFNQLIDRHIDAKNPRTQGRILPTGRAALWQVRGVAWGSLSLFLLICCQINSGCCLLGFVAALLIFTYSYLKRLHVLCHIVLGCIHLLGPVMAALAIADQWIPTSLWLGLAACCVIVGNDIVYAIQDYHFDRQHRLHSIPAYFGIQRSLRLAQLAHAGCVLALLCLGGCAPLHRIYLLAPISAALFFLDFHQKVKPLVDFPELALQVTPLFFRCNVSISIVTLLGVCLGIL